MDDHTLEMFGLEMFVVYDHPTDYPEHFVVRRWRAYCGAVVCDPEPLAIAASLEAARAALPWHANARLMRNPADEPQIVETWI